MGLLARTARAALASLALLGAGAAGAGAQTAVKIDRSFGLTPLLSGLYVAKDKGFFEERGIAVEFTPPSGSESITLVGIGRVEFAVSSTQNLAQARAQGIPAVAIASLLANNTSAFVSLREKGITRPKDFEGKTYGGWGGPIEGAILRAAIAADGGNPELLTYVNIGATSPITAIRAGDVDLVWTWVGWDVVRAEKDGLQVNYQYLRDYEPALNWHTPILIASEALIASDPETVQKVIDAVAAGYEYAAAHPAEAAAILVANEPDLDAALIEASQAWYSKEYSPGGTPWGWQRPEQWDLSVRWLIENGIIPAGFDTGRAFSNRFIEARPAK